MTRWRPAAGAWSRSRAKSRTSGRQERRSGTGASEKGEPIGVAVTARGKDAQDLLKRLFEAKSNAVKGRSFDEFGNLSFGIGEHIDIPGVKYDPQIGILGLEAAVALARPGYGIRKRSKHKARVGKRHVITSEEAKGYMTERFGVSIT